MPRMNYAVVSFINDDAASDEEIASEFPVSWLSENKTKCWWPQVKNVNTLITKNIFPATDNPKWELHDVNCQGLYETLEVARRRAENIYSSSDESQKSSRVLRKKFVKTMSPILDSDNSNRGEIQNMNLPQFPADHFEPQCSKFKIEKLKKSTSYPVTDMAGEATSELRIRKVESVNIPGLKADHSNLMTTINSTAQYYSNADISLNDINLDDIPIPLNHDADLHTIVAKNIEALHEKVSKTLNDNFLKAFEALASLTTESKTLGERINKIEHLLIKSTAGPDVEVFAEISQIFPFKTTQNILNLEESLMTNPELVDKLVKYLSQIAGNNAKENVIRIMRRVFTNPVAQKLSWLGLRKNFKISSLKTIVAIKAAVTSRFTFSDKDLEEIASEWLRQAKQRLVREEKKAQKD